MVNPTYTNATQPTIGNVAITDSCVQGIRANWQTAILDPNIALWLLGLSEDLIQQCYYLEEKSDVRVSHSSLPLSLSYGPKSDDDVVMYRVKRFRLCNKESKGTREKWQTCKETWTLKQLSSAGHG